jgi:hypothetical protein
MRDTILAQLNGPDQDLLLDALRHSIKYASSFLEEPTQPFVSRTWTEIRDKSYSLYRKLGGIYNLEELI